MQDRLLLREFVTHNSQSAFAEIVQRYLRLVYSTCLREVGDRQVAEDVTQGVFLILAQKAPSLGKHTPLAGWLFRTARLASKSALRQEQRRRRREQSAAEDTDGDAWRIPEPCPSEAALNDALATLRSADREAVLLRFFEEKPFREVGEALGVSEDTAQKRVSRALDKMRAHLVRHGEALSLIALGSVLSTEAARAVPVACASPLLQIIPGLKIALETSSLFGSRSYQISQGVLRTMKAKSAMTAASVGVLAVASVSILMAGAGKDSGSIVGTWTGKIPQYVNKLPARPTNGLFNETIQTPTQELTDMTVRFRDDGTFTLQETGRDPQTRALHTLTVAGRYTLVAETLTTTLIRATLNGKAEAAPAGTPFQRQVLTFSRGGKTLTLADVSDVGGTTVLARQ